MRILWVEDEPEILKEYKDSFQNFAEVDQRSDFIESLTQIKQQLHHYDLLILDIDLRHSNMNGISDYLVPHKKNWKLEMPKDLLHEAGFHIYLEAYRQNFPTDFIVFFTGNFSRDERTKMLYELIAAMKSGDAVVFDDFIKKFDNDTQVTSFSKKVKEVKQNKNYDALTEWYQKTFGELLVTKLCLVMPASQAPLGCQAELDGHLLPSKAW